MANDELPIARRNWRTLEPYHGFVYFAPEAAEEFAAVGLEGRSGYFVSRAAPMGAVVTEVVQATFFNFEPGLVRAAVEAVDFTPGMREAVIAARYRAVDRVLRSTIGDAVDSDEMRAAADLACRAASAVDCAGRPLAAGHSGLPVPGADHLRLWWAISILREYRGDGHIAALVDAGLSGLDALLLHGGAGVIAPKILQTTRAWGDDAWASGLSSMQHRGLLHPDGQHTAAGAALWAHIEARTDALATPAWSVLSDDESATLRQLVRPWSKEISTRLIPQR